LDNNDKKPPYFILDKQETGKDAGSSAFDEASEKKKI
jgi:hypothetical protein